MKKFVTMLTIMVLLIGFYPTEVQAANHKLDEEQTEIAEYLAEVCTDNWEEYGVLPSVCIAQAYMESHIGKYCYSNNLWGLYGGYTSFDSLEEGTYEYLEIINNGYYDDALYLTDYEKQINAIYDGGYCTSSREHYVGGIIWIIEEFDLTKYDQEIYENCYKKTSMTAKTWKHR